jgi:hypothetical protein
LRLKLEIRKFSILASLYHGHWGRGVLCNFALGAFWYAFRYNQERTGNT